MLNLEICDDFGAHVVNRNVPALAELFSPILERLFVDVVFAALAAQSGFKAGASDPRGITHIGHRDQLIDFLQAIDEDRPPLVDGREGRKSVEIIRAIYRSAETGAQVMLPLDD